MGLSTLRQAPRSDRLRSTQSITTIEDDLRSLENATARFNLAPCVGFSIVHPSSVRIVVLVPPNAGFGKRGSCVLLFRNARVLPCWPGAPPTGTITER
jgi:hypothetical protein